MAGEELTEEIDTVGEIYDGDIDAKSGSLLTAVRQATSGQRASGQNSEGATNERNNRSSTSDEFDPRSTLHRDQTTLEDAELSAGDEFDVDEEGNPLNRKQQPPAQPGAEAAKPAEPVAPVPDVFAVAEAEGVDLKAKFRTPADAMKGLVHAYRLVGARNESAQEWDRLVNDPARQREIYAKLHEVFGAPPSTPKPADPTAAAPAAPAAPTAPAAPAAQRPTPPKLPRGWQHHYVDGQPKPNADPNVIAAVEEYRADRLMLQEDPQAYFQKYFAPAAAPVDVDKVVEEKLKAIQAKQAEEQDRLRQENERSQQVEQMKISTIDRMEREGWFKWLYEPGYQISGSNITGTLSPNGVLFNQFVAEAAAITDHGIPVYPTAYQRATYARNKLIEHAQSQGAAPQGHAAPTNDARLQRQPGGDVGTGAKPGVYPSNWTLQQKLAYDLRTGGAALS